MKHNAIIVSAPAIQRGPQGNFVYVVTPDQTASARPVTVGTTEGDDVEINSGLQAGETVVVEGQDKLQDGNKVETRPGGPSSGGGMRPRRPLQPAPSAPPPAGLQTPRSAGPQTPPTAGRRPNK